MISNLDSHEFVGDENDASNQSGDAVGEEGEVKITVVLNPQATEQDEPMETETETVEAGTTETAAGDEKGKTEGEDGEKMETADTTAAEGEKEIKEKTEKEEEEEEEYNPLIVRRSRRAIKPTKDVDLYLLGAKFGIDVESDADSSDQEFAPVVESDRK